MSNVPKSPAPANQKTARDATSDPSRESHGEGERRARPARGAQQQKPQAAPQSREPRPPRPPRPVRAVQPNPIPPITFPEALPVSGRREEIAKAIAENQVVIVCGETGSGKTTQLPKICLALGRGLGAGGSGLIGHTQPRPIA